jgi:GAF domain-containing protein
MLVDGEPASVAVTDHVALELDMVQYRNDDGPCIAALGGEAVRIGFLPRDERFPHFAVGAADRRVLSVLSTPAIDHGEVVGSLNVYSRSQEAFDEHDRQTGLVMAGEIASALVKSAVLSDATELRERLQERHDTTLMVARAQGVMMAVQDCSAAQADDLIRAAAADNREPIIRTAERIVASVQAESAPLGQPSSTTSD